LTINQTQSVDTKMKEIWKDVSSKSSVLFVLLLIVVLLLWVLYWYLIGDLQYPVEAKDRGLFGDMFGAFNALFAAFAFAAIILTIHLQSKELKLQRQELEQTRKELKGQKDQLKAQNDTWRQQNFNNMFFQLLGYFDKQANSVYLDKEDKVHVGRSSLEALRDSFIPDYISGVSYKEQNKDRAYVISVFNDFLHQPRLLAYFQVFSKLTEFLEINEVKNKLFYAKLIEALLTDPEKVLIFYYGLLPEGKNIKAFAEKYGIFGNLNESLMGNTVHKSFYQDSAFAMSIE